MIKLFNEYLDGKQIAYCNATQFYIQIGKGNKGSYKTKYKLVGSLAQAVYWYNGVNVGNGYKKRLVMCDKVLTRKKS